LLANHVVSFPAYSTQNKETICSSETSVAFQQTTEDSILQTLANYKNQANVAFINL
jgi:hypothetical protein